MIGLVFAVVIVKQIFRRAGQQSTPPWRPGDAAGILAKPMTTWIDPAIDAIASATPLAQMAGNHAPAGQPVFRQRGGLYQGDQRPGAADRRGLSADPGVISWRIPAFIGTFAVLTAIFGGWTRCCPSCRGDARRVLHGHRLCDQPRHPGWPADLWLRLQPIDLYHPPVRGYPEGVSFAILLMNVCTPLIERGYQA